MYARHKDFRLFAVILLVSLAVTSLIGCTGNEPPPTEEPAPIPQVEEPEPEIQASDYVFPPTSFADLPEVEGELCPEFSNPAQQVKMVGVGESNAGGALIVFETGFPISMARTQTTLKANGADLPFDCEQVPNSKNQFYCWGAPLSPGTESEITLDVQLVEYDPFDLVVLAPTLAERLSLPEGQGLEEAWQTFYNCRLDPHAPGCDLLEATLFPPEFDPYGEETPGLVYIWDLEVGFPDLQNVPVFPGRDWDELAESMPDNCVLDLRPLANQCAEYVFQPMAIDEITDLQEVMNFIEYVWDDDWLPIAWERLFVVGDYKESTGEVLSPPLDPQNWTYEEMAALQYIYVNPKFTQDEGFIACMDFMIQGQACFAQLGRSVSYLPDLPNCATEEAVDRVNQCLEDDGILGILGAVEVGDMEKWLEIVEFLENKPFTNDYYWDYFACDGNEEYCDWFWRLAYSCVDPEDVFCIEEYLEIQQMLTSYSMTSAVVPECDPDYPESPWCQIPEGDDEMNEIAQDCGEEVGWTGELQTYTQQAQLLRTVALGLPWVEDLRQFPACNRFYNLSSLTYEESFGIPLQTQAVCRSMQEETGTQTATASFMIPFLGGQQAADDGDDGGSPALACNSCMDATACVAAGGTPNPSATQICTRCNCP